MAPSSSTSAPSPAGRSATSKRCSTPSGPCTQRSTSPGRTSRASLPSVSTVGSANVASAPSRPKRSLDKRPRQPASELTGSPSAPTCQRTPFELASRDIDQSYAAGAASS